MSDTIFITTEVIGIKAIQFLQKLAGIDESEEKARKGWNGMSPSEQQNTMGFYARLSGDTTVLYRRPIQVAKPQPKPSHAKSNHQNSRLVPKSQRSS